MRLIHERGRRAGKTHALNRHVGVTVRIAGSDTWHPAAKIDGHWYVQVDGGLVPTAQVQILNWQYTEEKAA